MKISTFLFWKRTVSICVTLCVATTPGRHRFTLHGSLGERLMSGPSGADFISHPALHLLICIHRRLIIFNCDRFRIRIKFYSSHLKFSNHPDIEAWFSRWWLPRRQAFLDLWRGVPRLAGCLGLETGHEGW